MENESVGYEQEATSEQEIEKEWLSLPDAEKEAHRIKAAAFLAEAVRTLGNESHDEALRRWHALAFRGSVGKNIELIREDYENAEKAIADLKNPENLMDRIGIILAHMQLDLMAKKIMWHDRKSL